MFMKIQSLVRETHDIYGNTSTYDLAWELPRCGWYASRGAVRTQKIENCTNEPVKPFGISKSLRPCRYAVENTDGYVSIPLCLRSTEV